MLIICILRNNERKNGNKMRILKDFVGVVGVRHFKESLVVMLIYAFFWTELIQNINNSLTNTFITMLSNSMSHTYFE